MNEEDPALPKRLTDDLARLHGTRLLVPPEVDGAILASARRQLGRQRRVRPYIYGLASAAAAAAVILALRINPDRPAAPAASSSALSPQSSVLPSPRREDLDRNGRIDILDAFALARRLEKSASPNPAWDMNGDGVIDRKDVDVIAMAAVNVRQETIR